MATISLTMNACSGSSTSQKVYYGKTNLVTGTGLNGTGWTLYSGSPISASNTTVTLTGLEDNVDYSVERYCNCPTSGDTGPERLDKLIKNVCGNFTTITPGSTTVNYQLSLPPSLNAAGTWVDKVLVELLNFSGTTVLQTNIVNRPFSSFFTPGNFAGLNPGSAYKIRMKFVNNAGTRSYICALNDVNTKAACSAPTVSLSNIGPTSMSVNWSVNNATSGDTYNIIKNGTTVVSGLALSSSPYTLTGLTMNTLYQIAVQRNCAGGTGTATGQTSGYTVNGPTISMTCNTVFNNAPPSDTTVRDQCFTIGDSVAPGNRFCLTLYGKQVCYTSIPGDNKYDVAFHLANAVDAVTEAEWRAAPNPPPLSLNYYVDLHADANGPGYPTGHIIGTRSNAAYTVTAQAYVS